MYIVVEEGGYNFYRIVKANVRRGEREFDGGSLQPTGKRGGQTKQSPTKLPPSDLTYAGV